MSTWAHDKALKKEIEMRLNDLVRICIIKVLDDKCMFHIEQIPGKGFLNVVVNPQVAGVAGVWGPYRLELNPEVASKKEIEILAVLAHEFTHVWQNYSGQFKGGAYPGCLNYYDRDNPENPYNIPFRGRLIVEGSANWGEYKVLDYYAAEKFMLDLHPSHPSVYYHHPDFDEYWLGFLFCLYIEEHHSFVELIEFLQSGTLLHRDERFIRGLTSQRQFISDPSMYMQLYGDERLGILPHLLGSSSINDPDLGEYLCLRDRYYMNYPYAGEPHLMQEQALIGRFTYIKDVTGPGLRSIAPEAGIIEQHPVLKTPVGQLLDRLEQCLREEIRALGCFECKLNEKCAIGDVCYVHASGDPEPAEPQPNPDKLPALPYVRPRAGRSATELQLKVLNVLGVDVEHQEASSP